MRKKHALLIASSEYPLEPKLQNLRFAENDVDGLFKVLGDKTLGGFDSVVRLKNKPHHEIRQKIQFFLSNAAREDLVLIYFAGHGLLDSDMQLYLATNDTKKVALETTSVGCGEIRKLIGKSRANAVIILLDCCYSGAFGNSFRGGDVDEQLNILAGGGTGTFVFTASEGLQVAKEVERDGHGIFTKHLIDGISGKAAEKKTGQVTIDKLISYVEKMVIRDPETNQRPQSFNLYKSGELVISTPTNRYDDRKREDTRPSNQESKALPKGSTEKNEKPISTALGSAKAVASTLFALAFAGFIFWNAPPLEDITIAMICLLAIFVNIIVLFTGLKAVILITLLCTLGYMIL